MTDIIVEAVKVDRLLPIKDADRIAVVQVGGYQTIVRKEDFKEGDLGVFISVDSVVPQSILEHYNLDIKKGGGGGRVKTKKLKGVYSQGLLLKPSHPIFSEKKDIKEGDNLAELLGITKYQPPLKHIISNTIARPWPDPRMTVYDIENLQNPHFRDVFSKDDLVLMTEKIHGMHGTVAMINGQFYYTSRRVSLEKGDNIWYRMVEKYNLENIVKELSHTYNTDIVIRYEIYGKDVQELDYGLQDQRIAVFDIEKGLGNYMNPSLLYDVCTRYKLAVVKALYFGPFSFAKAEELAEKDSVMGSSATCVSEGVVVRPIVETSEPGVPRRILKQISKRYLAMRKGDEVKDE